MVNSNYWRRRAERLEKQIHSGDRVPISRIMRLYKHAFDEIEDDIRRTMSARDELNRTEVEALKAEMIKIGASAPDPIRQAQITRAVSAYDYRIDRMEWLKSRAYMHLMKVAGTAAAIALPHLKNAYKAARYGTIDDIAKGLNIGIDFSLIPKRTIDRVVNAPFHGKNYSQRVWDNTAETAAKAQKIIVEGLIKGSSYPHMAQELARVTNNTYYNAYRLIQTEVTHFTEMGRFDAYKDIGIEKYTYYATLGSKTCDVCAALDGKTFNIDEGIEGKNKPPIHPHCMCYTVIGDVKLTSRLARDPETGKNYKVRGDMTYNEWYEGLSQEKKTAIKAYKNRHTDEVQYTKYVKRLGGENMPKTLELFQKMKYNDSERWGELKGFYRYKDRNPMSEINDYRCARRLLEIGVKGDIHIPSKKADDGKLLFDDLHINKVRKHNVNEEDAKKYIRNAVMSITKRNGLTENYYHKDGIAYINPSENIIKTAFKRDEFSEEVIKIMEVLREYGY